MHSRQIQSREPAQPPEMTHTASHGSAPGNPTKYPRPPTRCPGWIGTIRCGRKNPVLRKWEKWFIQTAVGDFPTNRAKATIPTRTFLFDKRLPTARVKPGPSLSRTSASALGLACRRKKKEKTGKDSSSGSSIRRVPIWHSVDFADESRQRLRRAISSNESPETSKPPTELCEAGSPIPMARSHSSLIDSCLPCNSSQRWPKHLRDSSCTCRSATNHVTGTNMPPQPTSGSGCPKTLLGRSETQHQFVLANPTVIPSFQVAVPST